MLLKRDLFLVSTTTVCCLSVLITNVFGSTLSLGTNKQAGKVPPKRGNGMRRAFSKDNVRYILYPNSTNPEASSVLRMGDVGSLSSYDSSKGLIMILHGFKQNYTDKYPQDLKNALLKRREASNIVLVSWVGLTLPFKNPLTGIPLSTREASKNIQRVSKHVTEMIMYLKNETKLNDMKDVHLIGHGLGAQIAGVVGFRVKHVTGDSIGRITGLDPSGPTHTYTALSEKLDKTDGLFVDVSHTANGPFGPSGSIGHVDFYPNGGGPSQPDCKLPADEKRDLEGFPGSCSSAMAWDYYIRSVMEDGIKACESSSYLTFKLGNGCQKQVNFGHRISHNARGDYFLSIRSMEPARSENEEEETTNSS